MVSQVGPGCWGAGGATVDGMGVSYLPPAPGPSVSSSWEPSPHLARETWFGANSPGRARAEAEGTVAEQGFRSLMTSAPKL